MDTPELQYHEIRLTNVIKYYIQAVMKKKDWEVVSIDPSKNCIILKRFEHNLSEIKGKK